MEVKDVEQYEIDLNKVRSFDDLFLIIKTIFPGRVFINSLSPCYEDLKHLAKDEES